MNQVSACLHFSVCAVAERELVFQIKSMLQHYINMIICIVWQVQLLYMLHTHQTCCYK